jgi:hypothetical protein
MAFSGLRFPNLSVIVDKRIPIRGKEWCCIDLAREKLFNDDGTAPPPAPQESSEEEGKFASAAADAEDHKNKMNMKTMQRATLRPSPNMKFPVSKMTKGSNWYVDFLPLAGRNLLRVHDSGRTVLTLGAGSCVAKALPNLQSPKRSPLALVVPSSVPGDGDNGIGSILVMERSPVLEPRSVPQLSEVRDSHQFEALVYCGISESWESIPLPPPPFMYNNNPFFSIWYPTTTTTIRSYAVVPGGGSHAVCISVDAGAGAATYCFDTATRAWTKVGDWKLPFIGRAEYVKELKLWFGICPTTTTNKDKEQDLDVMQFQLGAADLSTMSMDSQSQQPLPQPQLVGTWNELKLMMPPHGWTELRRPQFVNLGSGRFCIARFFFDHERAVMEMKEPTRLTFGEDDGEHEHGEDLLTATVITGADVTKHTTTDDDNLMQLQMITHNSIRHVPDDKYGNIQLVF